MSKERSGGLPSDQTEEDIAKKFQVLDLTEIPAPEPPRFPIQDVGQLEGLDPL